MSLRTWLATTVFFMSVTTPILAADLNTGEPDGAYQTKLCPTIKQAAKAKNLNLNCTTSAGSLENIERIIGAPNQFGLSQYDIYAQTISADPVIPPLKLVRDDIGSECLFLVTKNKQFSNYGDIVASAPYLNFVLPPEKSGHSATFKYLQTIDKTGLGRAKNIAHAATTEDAITRALSSEDSVTLFVQTPDPKSKYFSIINANGGHFIPAISREILGLEVNGKKVYAPQETAVTNPKWHKSGEKVITACTPIVLFTGHTEQVKDEQAKNIHKSAITALEQIPADKLKPKESWYSWLWTSSKKLSGKTVESMLEATDKARKASSPYVKKAKETSEPYVEKAKEKTKQAIEAAKPILEKAKEKTKQAIEAAKPGLEKAAEKAKELGKSGLEKAGEAIETLKEKAQEQIKTDETPEGVQNQ